MILRRLKVQRGIRWKGVSVEFGDVAFGKRLVMRVELS